MVDQLIEKYTDHPEAFLAASSADRDRISGDVRAALAALYEDAVSDPLTPSLSPLDRLHVDGMTQGGGWLLVGGDLPLVACEEERGGAHREVLVGGGHPVHRFKFRFLLPNGAPASWKGSQPWLRRRYRPGKHPVMIFPSVHAFFFFFFFFFCVSFRARVALFVDQSGPISRNGGA